MTMRALVDIVHPAHVHFYRHLISSLRSSGADVTVVARDKDVTVGLLRRFGIEHQTVGRHTGGRRVAQTAELARRDLELFRIARRTRPDIVLTRNPSGAQVARAVRTVGVFDTDDGRAAGIHWRAAAPFAHVITTPDCLKDDFGPRHRRYPGYKSLAYLHPNHFTPDPSIRDELGVGRHPYTVVRFVAMDASHDRHESGLSAAAKRALVDRLRVHGHVFITSEAPLPPDLEALRFEVPPDRVHDALAFADLYVGDSQTMAAEAAILGTPSLRASSFTGRLDYLDELENRYGLVHSYLPSQVDELLADVDGILRSGAVDDWEERRQVMLSDKVDVSAWYLGLVQELTA